jgi:hypothetical protein
MEVRAGAFPPPSEESWKAFEGYLRGSLLGARIVRVIDQEGPGALRFGFRVELGDEVRAVRVTHEFWRNIEGPHIRTALSMIRLADQIRDHDDVTIGIEGGRPEVRSA